MTFGDGMGCGPARRPRHSPCRRPGLRPGMKAPCQELADGETEKTFSTKSGFPEKRGPERQEPRWSAARRRAARHAARSVPQGMDLTPRSADRRSIPLGVSRDNRNKARALRAAASHRRVCDRPSHTKFGCSIPLPCPGRGAARSGAKRSRVVRRRTGARRWRLPRPNKAPALRCSRPRRAVRRIASGARRNSATESGIRLEVRDRPTICRPSPRMA